VAAEMSGRGQKIANTLSRSSEPSLSTREVARLIRVSEATVKRWADDGVIACVKSPGGHRRYRQKDVQDFLSVRGFDDSPSHPPTHENGLMTLALAGQATPLANAFISELNQGTTVEALFDGQLLPLLEEIRASDSAICLCHSLLEALNQLAVVVQSPPTSGLAVCGSLGAGPLEVVGRMSALVLRKHGYRVLEPPSHLSLQALCGWASREQVRTLVLAVDAGAPALSQEFLAHWSRDSGIPVAVGVSMKLPTMPAPLSSATSFADLSAFVSHLSPLL
jgi:excisionase family DNA binding protein